MTVKVQFIPDKITIEAQPGELILDVAKRAGVFIPTGCLMGSCHACEVELGQGNPVCSCISVIPAGSDSLNIYIYSDPIW
ncbi:2Fe-2S iron-sulfur cluster-binding protein [cyanobacterium endosymbiont of Epithemia clementina EcSB]|uniref:2Fe-2S iron-sulfur cluster-binding protein n=1 Tax=cyanobacterium endosymbiont of Epithemia clementina EcSB TaxID=3034674 RepID=UPI0024801419|nr:2Fe-2S iron-sulfur cluster binding domain-containing protein [cyanobacterium endosymbiont of Epithemia clementina EcSB]WGT67558.1 2Fe-2S iron-sulfur cluster binding domain-containing protein [cyanobacterium endosymbiont of Epithemia clementina EcSB]